MQFSFLTVHFSCVRFIFFVRFFQRYLTSWLEGAKNIYNLNIDYIGIWNEHTKELEAEFVIQFRKALDTSGFQKVEIIVADGDGNDVDVCYDLNANGVYSDVVGKIGLHYTGPHSIPHCHQQGKPVWCSEAASAYNDLNGAGCWAQVAHSHYVQSGITASIIWNLVGSYYHGTDWYASSLMTAVQPWSGYYELSPVLWATAHMTQFAQIGWHYLNGLGCGQLDRGTFYTTRVDMASQNFTLSIVKTSRSHALCARPNLTDYQTSDENLTFVLAPSMGHFKTLSVWYSNFEHGSAIFERRENIRVENDGSFTIHVPVGALYTISTIQSAAKGVHPPPPNSTPAFPLPYRDDFNSYNTSSEAKYFSDQMGVFEIQNASQNYETHNKVMRQMVLAEPVWWGYPRGAHPVIAPVSLIGMVEWADIKITVDFYIPLEHKNSAVAACIATRSDQKCSKSISLCVGADSIYVLRYGGPKYNEPENDIIIYPTKIHPEVKAGQWYTLSLATVNDKAFATLDGETLFYHTISNLDNGFAMIGASGWYAIEFDNILLEKAGSNNWAQESTSPCPQAKEGTAVTTRPCPTNGLTSKETRFVLRSSFQIEHIHSGLCVAAKEHKVGSEVVLETCQTGKGLQRFFHDYTRIRHRVLQMNLTSDSSFLQLAGKVDGTASIQYGSKNSTRGYWTSWVYFPNTNQLRNQYTANDTLGYPMCLSTCGSPLASRLAGSSTPYIIPLSVGLPAIAITTAFIIILCRHAKKQNITIADRLVNPK